MLKNILERTKTHLMMNIDTTHSGTVDFDLASPFSGPQYTLVNSGGPYRAYYLAWREDSGLFMDLPAAPTGTDPIIFLTANLTGCCVGIQNYGGFIRVRHYNLATDDDHKPVFSHDDLARYGTNISWLLPADKYNAATLNNATSYTHFGPWTDAVIWGEYVARYWPFTSKWHFYYQDGNASTVVRELNYQ